MASLATPAAIEIEEASAGPLRVEAVTDYSALLQLEPAWNSIAQEAGLDHPFLEHVWARTWWESFGKAGSLNILVVWAGAKPIAIAPLMRSEVRMFGMQVRRLGFLYNAHVPRADFLVAERPDEVYAAIWSYLARDGWWDIVQLCQLPEGSRTLSILPEMARRQGLPTGIWRSGASPYIGMDMTWAGYCESLASKHRSNLRNRFKRLRAIAPAQFETVRGSAVDADNLEEGLRLEAAAWKKDAGTAIVCDTAVRDFYTTLGRRAAERGWTRLHFLRSGDQRIAFDFSLEYKNQAFLLKQGYDPAFAPYSPSNLLLSELLEDCFDRGIARYDLLGDIAAWKQCWTDDTTNHDWLFIFSGGLKGRLAHQLKFRLTPLLKSPHLERIRRFALRVNTHSTAKEQ